MINTAVFGGGCFWCIEAAFLRLRGVVEVMPGYTGGTKTDPTYEEVHRGDSGHVEVIKISYDPSGISYADLLSVFFTLHDPTTLNRQGHDVGEQYASVIFYTSDEQQREAQYTINQLGRDNVFTNPIVTQLKPLETFFPAEKEHRQYYDKNPKQAYCTAVIDPKIVKLRQKFSHLLKDEA